MYLFNIVLNLKHSPNSQHPLFLLQQPIHPVTNINSSQSKPPRVSIMAYDADSYSVVLDNGSGMMKAGFSGDDAPRFTILSITTYIQ